MAATVHNAPYVSKATRVVSYQSAYPGVPHTVTKVSSYTPAATAVHIVHASVSTAVVHHTPAFTVHTTEPDMVAGVVHHSPAVSKATRVASYQSPYPGVPHTIAKVSSYTPVATAVHTVHASAPIAVVNHALAYAVHAGVRATVAGVVHPTPSYAYGINPVSYRDGHQYQYHPVRYVHGDTH
ncbi:hypothetical protein MRX96_044959 [Rhipicephalus microplus]